MLVSLSNGYAHAAGEAARAAYVAAAAYGYYSLRLQTVLSFAIGTFGYLLWCVPMVDRKSTFGRGTAILGIIMSVMGLIGSTAPMLPSAFLPGLFQFLVVPLCAVWFVLLGVKLARYGRGAAAAERLQPILNP